MIFKGGVPGAVLAHGLVIGRRTNFQLLPFGPRTCPRGHAAVTGLAETTTGEALLCWEAISMRYRIEFIRVVPGQEDEVLETITLGAATVRAAEAKAHALFESTPEDGRWL